MEKSDFMELEKYLKEYEEKFNTRYVTSRYLSPKEVIEDIKVKLKTGENEENDKLFDEGIPIQY